MFQYKAKNKKDMVVLHCKRQECISDDIEIVKMSQVLSNEEKISPLEICFRSCESPRFIKKR